MPLLVELHLAVAPDHDVIEVGGDPAVRERLRRLGQDFFIRITSGNVGQDELPDVALSRERGGCRRYINDETSILAFSIA